ncbi:MAG TPA: prepilin-type N-terminal cleavage/methylation domain-containing protein [Alphaproteobacteria bacterium]|jgi:prepilin-type N-terminal cleavage/methylation domain-containing protein|nr:prepilin-type N-terminal cleavage/methylation domain-containing protein [Alphaproteobacteria bacterium]
MRHKVSSGFIAAAGFTLVELLIVIALLGTIATIVIAAINPIEQANKARDSKYTADASQMVSAIERFYASNSQFPWQVTDPTTYSSADVAFDFVNANDVNVGLCGTSCTSGTQGPLITSDELKNEFLSRDFVQNTTSDITKKLWIGKGDGSSSSVYACFTPLSKSARDTAVTNKKVVDLTAGFTTAGIPTYTTSCDAGAAAAGWKNKTCGICIPQ